MVAASLTWRERERSDVRGCAGVRVCQPPGAGAEAELSVVPGTGQCWLRSDRGHILCPPSSARVVRVVWVTVARPGVIRHRAPLLHLLTHPQPLLVGVAESRAGTGVGMAGGQAYYGHKYKSRYVDI